MGFKGTSINCSNRAKLIHPSGILYSSGDYALFDYAEGKPLNLWTIKAVGRVVGQLPFVFTIQTPDLSGEYCGYDRMMLNRMMDGLSKRCVLGFSWSVYDDDDKEVDCSQYKEFTTRQ